MKVWPFGVGFQEQASNHFKRLSLRVVVVSIEVKLRNIPQQVRIRKTNKTEPLLTRRNPEINIESGGVSISHYKSTGFLITV